MARIDPARSRDLLRESMNAVLFGLFTAVCWGCADFVARFTGRAVGPDVALAGMLVASAVPLTLLAVATSAPLIQSFAAWPLILATGLAVMAATLLLYAGLARGPIGMVAPIAGAYPAFNVVHRARRRHRTHRPAMDRDPPGDGGGRGGRALRAGTEG